MSAGGRTPATVIPHHRFGEQDAYFFAEGTHTRLYEKLGAHPLELEGQSGVQFGVWAPRARRVAVVGDFNGWDPDSHPLHRGLGGVWEGFVAGLAAGDLYKYAVLPARSDGWLLKADPFGFAHEAPPRSASQVWDLAYRWSDAAWLARRAAANALDAPISVYEVHLGSWRRAPEANSWLTYRDLAPLLAGYVRDAGFTHVEFLPVMEHPFDGSWGYQTTGYFAPTRRFGPPQEFMELVDRLHQEGVGVWLDWVPSHFAVDGHGLACFDGEPLYEHPDPRRGYHPDWTSHIFDYGRGEVRSFLLSSALFWLRRYHADGLRVDAVASMLYLDYSRRPGEWLPNEYGGKENLNAIRFLQTLNAAAFGEFPDIQMVAEESTAWPGVTRPVHAGGLGFGLKWDMGWMHDTLLYLSKDPLFRRYHHDLLTFRMLYAYTENFILPLSHDEVVHGKGSLLEKMPGDPWQKFANLRALYGIMTGMPGKKLLFMGGEIGQWREWNHDTSLDWHLLDQPLHRGLQRWVRDLNRLLRDEPALHREDFHPGGFQWLDFADADHAVLVFERRAAGHPSVVFVVHFTPELLEGYRIPLPRAGVWNERLNSDAADYGGSNQGNAGRVTAHEGGYRGQPAWADITVPPLGVLVLTPESRE